MALNKDCRDAVFVSLLVLARALEAFLTDDALRAAARSE